MAQVSYSDFEASNNREYDVEFFSVKPNSEAIVRIMCNSIEDLDILTIHPVRVGNASFDNKSVNCLRNPKEPMDQCPLCSNGNKISQKVFIKMIQYDSQTHQGKAVVWERAASTYVPMLKKYLDNYGPLSNIFCKIVRTGEGLDTKWDIVPNLNPQMYNDSIYPRMDNAFDNWSVIGTMVLDKTAPEMIEFIRTGNFPQRSEDDGPVQSQTATPQYTAPVSYAEPTPVSYAESVPVPNEPAVTYNPTPQGIPNGYQQPYEQTASAQAAPEVERPVRHY